MTDPSNLIPDMIDADQPDHTFPFGQTALWLSVSAAVLGLAGVVIAINQFPGEAPVMQAVVYATSMVWLVSVLSLVVVRMFTPKGAQTIAMAHFAATGGRALLCLLLGLFAVYGLLLPLKAVMFTAASVYLPLVVVESVFVARYVRVSYDAKLGVHS